jgi:hypothetical protein
MSKRIAIICDSCGDTGGTGPSASRVRVELRRTRGWRHNQAVDLCHECHQTHRVDNDGDIVARPETLATDKALS